VVNGMAEATIASGLLDFSILYDLFFAHTLSLGYGDSSGPFMSSSDSVSVPPLLLDFFLYEISLQMASLNRG
ncbi:MAG TPA: hypothetical protein VMG10_23485, partial [Gemmataceae bacterium]|nr:hypothetical protein [Gemmataceae bacterium]